LGLADPTLCEQPDQQAPSVVDWRHRLARLARTRASFLKTARSKPAWALAALSCLSVGLLLHVTALHGPGLGFDSAQYLSAADGLRTGAGFVRCDGTLYDIWAPLEPCLLTLPLELGASPGSAASTVNALSLAALIVLTGRMASAIAPGAGWIAALALVVSADLLWIDSQVLSEPAFMTLAVATAVATQWHARRPSGGRLALVAACGALACLQRYVGVTLIASTALALLAQPARDPLRLRARRAGLFALLAGAPLGVWMLRNLALTGTATGPDRGTWGTGLGAAWFLRRAWGVVQSWGSPGAGWPYARLALLAIAAAWLAVAAARSRHALAAAWRGPALAPALFVLTYGAFSWVYHANVDEDGVGLRELVPLLPFAWALLAGGALALVRAAGHCSQGGGRSSPCGGARLRRARGRLGAPLGAAVAGDARGHPTVRLQLADVGRRRALGRRGGSCGRRADV
jgi:hypothetical protein